MRVANPAFIPRNHLVEEAISAAVNVGDFQPVESLLTVLSMPYEDQPAFGRRPAWVRTEGIHKQLNEAIRSANPVITMPPHAPAPQARRVPICH